MKIIFTIAEKYKICFFSLTMFNKVKTNCRYIKLIKITPRKRILNQSINNPISVNYHFDQVDWKPNYRYNPGQNYNSNNSALLYLGSFQPGEGWTGPFSTNTMQMNFDSITVAPYMGVDSVTPFLDFPDKWVILLAATSNPGFADFQSLFEDRFWLVHFQ